MNPADTGMKLYKYPLYSRFPHITAFTTTRLKHNSGTNDALYPGSGEPAGNDAEEKFWYSYANIPESGIAKLNQVHGSTVVYAEKPGNLGDGDALITGRTGIFLRIVTADCLPVFMFDPVSITAALVHAGWRGVERNIIGQTIREMQNKANVDPHNLYVAIGPHIQHCCYTVQEDVASKFHSEFSNKINDRHFKLDLGKAAVTQLKAAGASLSHIEITSPCTCCSNDTFYSARGDIGGNGRNINVLGIR